MIRPLAEPGRRWGRVGFAAVATLLVGAAASCGTPNAAPDREELPGPAAPSTSVQVSKPASGCEKRQLAASRAPEDYLEVCEVGTVVTEGVCTSASGRTRLVYSLDADGERFYAAVTGKRWTPVTKTTYDGFGSDQPPACPGSVR